MQLKQLEIAREQMEKWDGKFPQYFMSGNGQTPNMLMQVPNFEK